MNIQPLPKVAHDQWIFVSLRSLQTAELYIPGFHIWVHLLIMEVQMNAQYPGEGIHQIALLSPLHHPRTS